MATLEIGRLHARYAGAAAGRANELDAALRRVAEDGLAVAAAGVRLPDAFAVCVPEITVAVSLDPGRPVAGTSREWAHAIIDAVRLRLDDGRGVVTYPRRVDALADLLRSAGRQDWTRAWAWVQAGLVGPTFPGAPPHGAAVAEALARHPEDVPAALVRARAEARHVLAAADWVRLAGSVRRSVGAPEHGIAAHGAAALGATLGAAAAEALPPADPASGAPVPGSPRAFAPAPAFGPAERAVAVVPAAIWGAVDSAGARRDLAVLTLAVTDPVRSRDTAAVAAVLAAAPHPGGGHGDGQPSASGAAAPSTGAEAADLAAAGTPAHTGGSAGPAAEGTSATGDAAEREPVASAWGGVLYCIHAITAIGLVEDMAGSEPGGAESAMSESVGADLGVALAHVLGAVTGAPPDDPAVLAATGCGRPHAVAQLHAVRQPLTTRERERRDVRAGRVRAWVADRLHEPADADLAWVWRRPVTLESDPGWLDATFPLSSVDVRLRRAGLDLDPGWVWWLGRVVRFRHV